MKINRGDVDRAFTLVELLVVVAIIALLIAALLPAFSTVRTKAKTAQTQSMFQALASGIQSFQAEQGLGGSLPPSRSDAEVTNQRWNISNPRKKKAAPNNNGGSEKTKISGAHLLAMAMVGSDGLGTPGFKDLNRDGKWENDTHDTECDSKSPSPNAGLYGLSELAEPCFTRYGAPGYVDEKMRDRLETIKQMVDKAKIVNSAELNNSADLAKNEPMFVDAFDAPILYYRANKAGLSMVGTEARPGIYWQEDNAVITGSDGLIKEEGLDFGPGKILGAGFIGYHAIKLAKAPEPTTPIADITDTEPYKYSFARFILDRKVTAKPTAVNPDSYLLISAGPDTRFGTDDDITNWSREQAQ